MTERLIPGGPYIDATGSRQALIPGGPYLDDTVSAGGGGDASITAAAGISTASTIAGKSTAASAITAAAGVATASTLTGSSAVTLISSPLKDNTGALHLSAPFEAFVLNATTGALVLRKTGLTSHASTGIVTFSDAAMTAATQYRVIWRQTTSGAQGVELLTAT